MRPPQKTLDEIREERQKVLDKRSRLLYNIRRRFGGIRDVDLIYNPSISQDLKESRDTNDRIYEIARAVKAISERPMFSGRCPILAGGAIRDMVFGIPVKDYDIFMDISMYDEDVQDDMVLLLAHSIMKEMGLDRHKVRNVTAETDYNGAPGFEAGFVVYEINPDWDQMDHAIDDIIIQADNFKPIQVIGRKDSRLSGDDLVEFLKDFDYGLVRCLFDPVDEQYRFHPSFGEQLGQKYLPYDNQRTYQRMYSWATRWGINQHKFPFIFKNEEGSKPAYTTAKSAQGGTYMIKMRPNAAGWQNLNWDVQADQIRGDIDMGLLNAVQGNPAGEQIQRARVWNAEFMRLEPALQERPLDVRIWENEVFEQQVAAQERDPFDEQANF